MLAKWNTLDIQNKSSTIDLNGRRRIPGPPLERPLDGYNHNAKARYLLPKLRDHKNTVGSSILRPVLMNTKMISLSPLIYKKLFPCKEDGYLNVYAYDCVCVCVLTI